MALGHKLTAEHSFLSFVVQGEVREVDIQKLIDAGRVLAQKRHRFWILADVTHMTGFSTDARRAAAQNPYGDQFHGAAVVGATTFTRTLITLVTRAMILLGRSHVDVRFFPSIEAGTQWIREHLAREDARRAAM